MSPTHVKSVRRGVDEFIDAALGVTDVGTRSPHYRCKEAALRLTAAPPAFDAAVLVLQIVARIEAGLDVPEARWRSSGGSHENWRWEKKATITPRQSVDEKTVEKAIVETCGADWANQVPTAFGLLDGTGERACNIDLVHRLGVRPYESSSSSTTTGHRCSPPSKF